MIELTKQELIARVATLPQKLKDEIAAPETLETLEKIGKQEGLDGVHVGLLHRLTVRLLAGVIAPQEFVAIITEDLGIEQEVAMRVAQEINRDILNNVREELKQIHGLTETPVETMPVATSVVLQKTGPSSFALPDAPVATPYVAAAPSMSAVPTARGVVPPTAPSPLMASLDIAAMKATPVAPAVSAIPVPQAPPVPAPVPQTPIAPQEPMRTITMDDTRTPIAPKPAVPPPLQATQGVTTPVQPSMNIFEEKLGTAFRMKSEQLVPTPNYTNAVVPATPSKPIPPAVPPVPIVPVAQVAQPTLEAAYVPAYVPQAPPRTSPQPMIGVVPAPAVPLSVPTRPQVVVPRPPLPQVAAPTLPIAPVVPIVPSVQPAPMPANAPVMPIPAVDPYRENV